MNTDYSNAEGHKVMTIPHMDLNSRCDNTKEKYGTNFKQIEKCRMCTINSP
jgi:hypothetical protein